MPKRARATGDSATPRGQRALHHEDLTEEPPVDSVPQPISDVGLPERPVLLYASTELLAEARSFALQACVSSRSIHMRSTDALVNICRAYCTVPHLSRQTSAMLSRLGVPTFAQHDLLRDVSYLTWLCSSCGYEISEHWIRAYIAKRFGQDNVN